MRKIHSTKGMECRFLRVGGLEEGARKSKLEKWRHRYRYGVQATLVGVNDDAMRY